MCKNVYICSTYYHVLIALIRTNTENQQWDLILTNHIPQYLNLAEKLRKHKLFHKIITIGEIREYVPSNKIDKLLFLHLRNKKLIKKQLSINFEIYEQRILFHDDTWVAHFFKECNLSYFLLEDALDSFTVIKVSPFSYMLPKHNLKFYIKKVLNIGYFYLLDSKQVQQIEVNSIKNLEIPITDQVRENSRKKMFSKLSSAQKKELYEIFLGDKQFNIEKNSTLLLTQPLYEDHIVSSYKKQATIYQRILSLYTSKNEKIYIKPHPRDKYDYQEFNVNVINRHFPVEILNYAGDFHFKKIITLFSTSIYAFPLANEKICLDINEFL